MSNRLLAALLLALCVSHSAYAADAKKCPTLALWKTMAAKNGGTFVKDPLTAFKLDVAKKLYAMAPPAGPEPKAEQALEINFDNGSGIVLFLNHGVSCNRLVMPPPLHNRFDALREPVPGELSL